MKVFMFTKLLHSLYKKYIGHAVFVIIKHIIYQEEDLQLLLTIARELNIKNDPTFNESLQYAIRRIIRHIEVFCKKYSISQDEMRNYLHYICPVIHRDQLIDMSMLIVKHVESPMRSNVPLEHLIPFYWKEVYFRVELHHAIDTEGEIIQWIIYDILGCIHSDIKKMYLEYIQSRNIPREWVDKKELLIRNYIHARIVFYQLTIDDIKHSIEHWSLTLNTLINATQYFDDYIAPVEAPVETYDIEWGYVFSCDASENDAMESDLKRIKTLHM